MALAAIPHKHRAFVLTHQCGEEFFRLLNRDEVERPVHKHDGCLKLLMNRIAARAEELALGQQDKRQVLRRVADPRVAEASNPAK